MDGMMDGWMDGLIDRQIDEMDVVHLNILNDDIFEY